MYFTVFFSVKDFLADEMVIIYEKIRIYKYLKLMFKRDM